MYRCLAAIAFILFVTACGEFGQDTPRAAWERTMQKFAAQDYGGLWDILSDQSRADTIRVLAHVRRDPKYRQSMHEKFQIPPQLLDTITPRDFYIALMSAMQRAAPEIVAKMAESAETAEFSRVEIENDRAVVYWRSTVGGVDEMIFVKEDRRWNPVIERR